MLLKVNLIKPGHLLSILNQIISNIQFTMEKNQSRYHLMINKSSAKIWKDIYSKPAD